MFTPNLSDTKELARQVIDALRDGRTVELLAKDRSTVTIEQYTAGHVIVNGSTAHNYCVPFVWIARELESLRNYGYLTASSVRII